MKVESMMASDGRQAEGNLDPSPSRWQKQSLGRVREEAEREHIISVLQLTGGNRLQAARILEISRKTLWKKLKHLGITWPLTTTER